MNEKPRLVDLYEDRRYQRIILQTAVIVLLLMQVVIYFAAVKNSGEQSFVVVTDAKGNTIYETKGSGVSSFEKLAFANTFGPMENYNVNVKTKVVPFPFRAWLSAAIGIPIGLVMLVAFVVKSYFSLFYGEDAGSEQKKQGGASDGSNLLGNLFQIFQRISIFHIGFLALVSVLILWLVPNFIAGFARFGLNTIREFKWFFAALFLVLTAITTWGIYLRYKLSTKMIEKQLDLEKFRIEQQLLTEQSTRYFLNDAESVDERASEGTEGPEQGAGEMVLQSSNVRHMHG